MLQAPSAPQHVGVPECQSAVLRYEFENHGLAEFGSGEQ